VVSRRCARGYGLPQVREEERRRACRREAEMDGGGGGARVEREGKK
jgi:hypothetical protein